MSFGYIEVTLITCVLVVAPFWMILRKAGYKPIWSLLALIPIINLVALWLFSLSDWPSHKRDA